MGASEIKAAVADTGPLIHLSEISSLFVTPTIVELAIEQLQKRTED